MKRALVVYELQVLDDCSDTKLRDFMRALMHIDNFGQSVSGIWRRSGQPQLVLIDDTPQSPSTLKRVRIIT